MFSIEDRSVSLADRVSRREWLRVGGLSALGLSLPQLLRANEAPASKPVAAPKLAGDLSLIYLVPLPFFAAAAWLFEPASWPRFAASLAAACLAAAALVFLYWKPFRAFFGRPSISEPSSG